MNDVISQWNNSAQKYKEEQSTSLYAEKNMHIVMKRFPRLNGEKILDLGCGYGLYTNYFKNIGGEATGIDGSEAMVNEARRSYPDCTFFISDITKPLDFADETFDIIFSNQVLMDIENIETVFSECHRILKSDGIFYYSIVHPAFYDGDWLENENGYKYAKQMKKYLGHYSFLSKFWGETTHFHRPLSYYLNTAANNGLFLVNANEPVSYDEKIKNSDLPLFFCAEYRKI